MVNGEPTRCPRIIHHSQFTIHHSPLCPPSTSTSSGPLTVTVDNRPATFRTDAQRALLAYLAAHQGTPQRRDALAALLSPDRPDPEALTYLRNRLTRLRRALGDDAATPPWLAVDRKQIALRTGDAIVIDLTQFEQHLAAVEAHAHRELSGCPICLARLQEASDLVRGEFLAGLNFASEGWEAWLLGQREHVQQRALAAMSQLREARIARGEWAAVLAVAQRQLALEPWLEAAHRALMQAHVQLDDRNAALAQYEQCAAVLQEELGVEPEAETQQLRQTILEGELRPEPVEGGGVDVPDNLPLQTSRFFGRDAEQEQLLDRLVDPAYRLITLVGTGGMGKTRLAIEVGRQVKTSFPDGICFVALDAVKGGAGQIAEQIQIAVGEAAGLGQGGKQLTGEQVLAILRDKRMLLILDNCEPVLDELLFIPTWLRRAPGLAILATSREPLNLEAESVVLLDGLPVGGGEEVTPSQPPPLWGRGRGLVGVDAGDSRLLSTAEKVINPTSEKLAPSPSWEGLGRGPAEAMFIERGQIARADFAVSAENLSQVRQICERVDGSPLGIALAAAWVRRRSLAQIVSAIDESLDFLSTRMRDVDPRHRSMKAVFEASWQLLGAEEQSLLAALSVFPTSFSAEAAQQVAGAGLADLDLLCEKSLLQQQHERERYAMHSLVRQFAVDKLGDMLPLEEPPVENPTAGTGNLLKQVESGQPHSALQRTSPTSRAFQCSADVEQAFVNYFYQFARDHQHDYAALQPEWRNLSAGVAKAHALELWQTVLDFVDALDEPWFRQVRFQEMRTGLSLALEAATALGDEAALARWQLRLGEVEMELNAYEAAEGYLGEALQGFMRLEEAVGIAQAKYFLGRIKVERTDDDEAVTLFEESRRIFEGEGDLLGVAKNLNLIAVCTFKLYRDFEQARAILEKSASLQQHVSLSSSYVETLRYLARVGAMLEAFEDAEQSLVEASDVSRQLNDLGEHAAVLYERTLLCKRRHQIEEALSFGYDCLDSFKQLGSLRWEGLTKTQLGLLHQVQREYDQALVLLGEGLQLFCELEDIYEQAYSYYYLSELYAEIGETAQSLDTKHHARRLNLKLNDPQLAERLK